MSAVLSTVSPHEAATAPSSPARGKIDIDLLPAAASRGAVDVSSAGGLASNGDQKELAIQMARVGERGVARTLVHLEAGGGAVHRIEHLIVESRPFEHP